MEKLNFLALKIRNEVRANIENDPVFSPFLFFLPFSFTEKLHENVARA